MLHSQSKLSESHDCVRWGPNNIKFALSIICAEGVPSLLSLFFLPQYHLAITKDNRSRMTVPITDVNHNHQALVDDAAISSVSDPYHAPEDQGKSLL
jgi:hypothetical protein